MALLWFNFIRNVASFHDHLDIVDDLVPQAAWSFFIASNCTVLFKISYKREIIKMIASQSKLCLRPNINSNNDCKDIKSSWCRYRSFAIFGMICTIVLVCLNSAMLGFYIHAPQFKSKSSPSVPCLPWDSGLACWLIFVLQVYGLAAWIFPVVFFAFICHILAGQLDELERDFNKTFRRKSRFAAESLNSFRHNFLNLCQSVKIAEEMFSPFVAISLSVNILIVIFLLYQIWFTTIGTLFIIISSIWIFGALVICAIISYYGILVNEKVNLT